MLVIRPETPNDHATVYELVAAAFERPAEADLATRLRHVEGNISLVAQQADTVVGHIIFSPAVLKREDGTPDDLPLCALGPIAVAPALQRSGIGSAMITAGLGECQAAGYEGCMLLGSPAYYPRFGFKPGYSTYGINSTYDVSDPIFMMLEFVPDCFANRTGTAHFHPTFRGL